MKKTIQIILLLIFCINGYSQSNLGIVTIYSVCNGVKKKLATFEPNQQPCVPIRICKTCNINVEYSFPLIEHSGIRSWYEEKYSILTPGWAGGCWAYFQGQQVSLNHDRSTWDLNCVTTNRIDQIYYNIDWPIDPAFPQSPTYPPLGQFFLSNLCITVLPESDCGGIDCDRCCFDFNTVINNNTASINQTIATYKNTIQNGSVPLNHDVFSNTLCEGEFILKCFGSTNGGAGTNVNISYTESDKWKMVPSGLIPRELCFKLKNCGCERCFSLE